MTIQNLWRVSCGMCERYLTWESTVSSTTEEAALFTSFSSAYDEALRANWTQFPLVCQDCTVDLRKKVRGEQVLRDDEPTEDDGTLRQPGQGAERPGRRG